MYEKEVEELLIWFELVDWWESEGPKLATNPIYSCVLSQL